MKGIEINGQKLHKVRMLQKSHHHSVVTMLSYPKSMIKYNFENENLNIKIPPNLVIELYKSGTLPLDPKVSVEIKESGKRKGEYLLESLIYPNIGWDNSINLNFKKVKSPKN